MSTGLSDEETRNYVKTLEEQRDKAAAEVVKYRRKAKNTADSSTRATCLNMALEQRNQESAFKLSIALLWVASGHRYGQAYDDQPPST